jgi:acetyl-CoA carboxylase carboxyltransferase component
MAQVIGAASTASLVEVRPIASGASDRAAASVCELDQEPLVFLRVGAPGGGLAFGTAESHVACRAVDDARAAGMPLLVHFAGATVDPADGPTGLAAWGALARALAAASGVVPLVAVVDGPVVTGLSLVLGLVDVVVVCDGALAFVSGPAAVSTTTGRQIDADLLGGSQLHTHVSGVAHLLATDLDHALAVVADLLAHLPPNNAEDPPRLASFDDPERRCERLGRIVPDDPRVGYDVRHVVAELADDGELLELGSTWGQAIVCGLARLGGHPVGVVANQPGHLAGAIDIASSQKAARFVQWCDAFGLPLLTLVDTPGYLPGRDLEWDGMIRHGGQLAFAYAAASVPRMCVILRKAYGGAYIVMDCKTMGNDLCLAWPSAEIAVMGAAGAVQVLEARRLAGLDGADAEAERARLEADYAERHLHPREALDRGFVDALVDPAETRAALVRALPSLLAKRAEPIRRKHRNGPL